MKVEILKDLYMVASGRQHYTCPANCNIYLLDGGKELVLIDAGAGVYMKSLFDSIRNHGYNPEDITLLINTHVHWDHTRGDRKVQDISGCKIAVHEAGVDTLTSGECVPPIDLGCQPVKVEMPLKDGDVIDTGKYQLQILHTPGESPDHICILMEHSGKKVLFSGDMVQTYSEDFMGSTNSETDMSIYRKSVERLNDLKVDILLPGHGLVMVEYAYENIEHLLKILSGKWRGFIPYPQPFQSTRWSIGKHPEWLDLD